MRRVKKKDPGDKDDGEDDSVVDVEQVGINGLGDCTFNLCAGKNFFQIEPGTDPGAKTQAQDFKNAPEKNRAYQQQHGSKRRDAAGQIDGTIAKKETVMRGIVLIQT